MHVTVMGREEMEALVANPFPPDTAVISITDSDQDKVVFSHAPAHLLELKFDDVSFGIYQEILGRKPTVAEMRKIETKLHMLSNQQAGQLAAFVLDLPRHTNLICQCEYGQSRSAAVAAAVMEHFYGNGIGIFADPRYYPNKFVFKKVLLALRNLSCRR